MPSRGALPGIWFASKRINAMIKLRNLPMPKAHHNVVLYEAMKRYVSTALDLVARRVVQQASQSQDDGDALFFTRLGMTDELQKLPEYQICLEALLTDPVITSQTEVLTGTNSGM